MGFKISTILILFCLLLTSCALLADEEPGVKNGDWSYYFSDKYCISRINSNSIILTEKTSQYSSSVILKKFVVQFCHNENTAIIKIRDTDADQIGYVYYTFDINTGHLSEPLREEELSMIMSNDENYGEWISTDSIPKNAVFT